MNELTTQEQDEYERHEANIAEGLKTFIEVGNSLLAIRDKRLYRRDYASFEEYCQTRWGMTRQHANRLVSAAEVAGNLEPIGSTPQIESHVRPLTSLPPEQQREVWQEAVETAPNGRVTAQHVRGVVERRTRRDVARELNAYEDEYHRPVYDEDDERDSKPHVSHNSGENEWYTPAPYIEAARAVMGGIDLDPATSDLANATVKATTAYTILDDGLAQPWYGRVWLNPPYSQPEIVHFSQRLVQAVDGGEVEQAVVLVNNATETGWFQTLLSAATAVCFPKTRIRFISPTGEKGTPLQGQAVLYFGGRTQAFASAFAAFGMILEPRHEL